MNPVSHAIGLGIERFQNEVEVDILGRNLDSRIMEIQYVYLEIWTKVNGTFFGLKMRKQKRETKENDQGATIKRLISLGTPQG